MLTFSSASMVNDSRKMRVADKRERISDFGKTSQY